MKKTTITTPDKLKKRLKGVANTTGRTKATVNRDAIVNTIHCAAPAPRIPLTKRGLGNPSIAQRIDELLEILRR